ncbi:hypothetical protein C8R46DRAFT_1094888, partial [Mycena filopes]
MGSTFRATSHRRSRGDSCARQRSRLRPSTGTTSATETRMRLGGRGTLPPASRRLPPPAVRTRSTARIATRGTAFISPCRLRRWIAGRRVVRVAGHSTEGTGLCLGIYAIPRWRAGARSGTTEGGSARAAIGRVMRATRSRRRRRGGQGSSSAMTLGGMKAMGRGGCWGGRLVRRGSARSEARGGRLQKGVLFHVRFV